MLDKAAIFVILLALFSCVLTDGPDGNSSSTSSKSGQEYHVSTNGSGWLMVNGERFFVKGVCVFDNHNINNRSVFNSPEIWDYEFEKIEEGGFNAVSTWFSSMALDIAKRHSLMALTSASHCCFTEIGTVNKEAAYSKIREVMQYSKDYDNILLYSVDNEPKIGEWGTYSGLQDLNDFYKNMIAIIKSYKSDALVTMTSFPPAANLDYSIFDASLLNLYPFNPANNSIGYAEYAEWFKNSRAANKPFIISEYGVDTYISDPVDVITNELDDQIAAGATGAFFYTWRTWGNESDEAKLGIVPNYCMPDDYKNSPRPVYYALQKYFEAVVIEPKKGVVYGSVLPVKVYGTDKTGSVEAVIDGISYFLPKTGKYWWEKDITVGSSPSKKRLIIRAKDKNSSLLVEKALDVNTSSAAKYLTVKINEPELAAGTVTARITVKDQDDQPAPNQPLVLGINQSGVDPWVSQSMDVFSDPDGEYQFVWNNAVPGFFTLMAGSPNNSQYPVTHSDAITLKVGTESVDYIFPMTNEAQASLFYNNDGTGTPIAFDFVESFLGLGLLKVGLPSPLKPDNLEAKCRAVLDRDDYLARWTNHTSVLVNVYVPEGCNLDSVFIGMFSDVPVYKWIGGLTAGPRTFSKGWNRVVFDMTAGDGLSMMKATAVGGTNLNLLLSFFRSGDGYHTNINMPVNVGGIAVTGMER